MISDQIALPDLKVKIGLVKPGAGDHTILNVKWTFASNDS
jgi:hypothetical protein